MKVIITPNNKVTGKIVVPASKSLTHRAIICAALANGISLIDNILMCDDTQKTIEACQSLGVIITQKKNQLIIVGSGGILKAPKNKIDIGESGTTLRFITALATLTKGKTIITGSGRIPHRPMKGLIKALKKLKKGHVEISGIISSQFISALLLIAPFTDKVVEIDIKDTLVSKAYVLLTIEVMKHFGVVVKNENFQKFIVPANQRYKARHYSIEGDFSSATYFFAAAAVTGGEVTVSKLAPDSNQSDSVFLTILEEMGCKVTKKNNEIKVKGQKKLKLIAIDLSTSPDSVPSVAAVAAYANGTTHIKNIAHLRYKESDRIQAIEQELKKMGIIVSSDKDSLLVTGGVPKGAVIDSHNDHRIAMSMAIAALGASGNTTIEHAEVVSKSYPNFFKDLQTVGVNIKEI